MKGQGEDGRHPNGSRHSVALRDGVKEIRNRYVRRSVAGGDSPGSVAPPGGVSGKAQSLLGARMVKTLASAYVTI